MPYIDFKAVKDAVTIDRTAQLLNLQLKQSGTQLRGQCPACQSDDDRSLAITPAKNVYFCHAGQTGGDCISLVAHILTLTMKDAAEWLQETLPQQRTATVPTKPEARNQPAPALKAFDPAVFAQKLAYTDEVKALGLSEEDAQRFTIGFVRGKVYFPVRDANGLIAGFIGFANGELKLPPQWLPPPSNVVQLKRGA